MNATPRTGRTHRQAPPEVLSFRTMALPAEQQDIVDALLAKYRPDRRLEREPALKKLAAYCRDEGIPHDWAELNDFGERPIRGYDVFLAQEWAEIGIEFSDDALRDARGWSERRIITDADRIRAIRRAVHQAVTMADECAEPFLCGGLPVKSRAGRAVVLAFAYRESTFGSGWHWFGVFDDVAEYRDWMRRSGWCAGMADLKELGDGGLEMWQRG